MEQKPDKEMDYSVVENIATEPSTTYKNKNYEAFQSSIAASGKPTFRSLSVSEKMQFVVRIVKVEPFVFLVALAFFMQLVAQQSLAIRKFCLIRVGLNESVCKNLTQNEEMEEKVQKLTVNYNMIKMILDTIPAIIFNLFIGTWSDRFGRKKPMLLSCIGGSLSMTLLVINAIWITDLPPEALLVTFLPIGFTGGLLGIMVCTTSYISDVSSPEMRTIRLGFMQMSFLLATPIGIAIGGIILSEFGYIAVFGTSLCIYVISFIYVALVIEETVKVHSNDESKSACSTFFDLQNVKECWKTLKKKREKNQRAHIILIILVMAVNMFPLFGEHSIALLYTRKRYKWSEFTYSIYSAASLTASSVGLMVCIPIFTRVLKVPEAIMGFIASGCKICNDIIIGLAQEGWLLFAACPLGICSGLISPITRSMMSKCVSSKEQGKINSIIAACESVSPAVAGVLYSLIYNNTRQSESTIGSVYFMSAGLFVIPLILFRFIIYSMKKHEKKYEEQVNDEMDITRF